MAIRMSFQVIFPIFMFSMCLYGVYHYLTHHDTNKCEMTYMFEHPEYKIIHMDSEAEVRFSRYSFYFYGEGQYFDDLNSKLLKKKEKINGIPVIFIPGNAGSHKQVRSLGSVALRMAHSLHSPVQFNFYSISFNEELSGFYGGTLMEQVAYLRKCVNFTLQRYSTKKVILIGHSMGGVVAKAIFSDPEFDASVVSLIITLAAPLKEPAVLFDKETAKFYDMIAKTWNYRLHKSLKDIPVISIGGGERDILVRSELAFSNFQHFSSLDISAMTTAIPGVWVSTDHLAITWCKQLIMTICRSLFDLIDQRTKQITTDHSVIEKVLKHHYVLRNYGAHYSKLPYVPIGTFPPTGQWIEQESNSWRFSRTKVLSTIYLLIRVTKNDDILIVASGLVKKDWIFGCTILSKSETITCSVGENISNRGQVIPSRGKKVERRMINIKFEELEEKKYQYLLVYITPVDSQVDILGERYNARQRYKKTALPIIPTRYHMSALRILSVSLPEQTVFYNITLTKAAGMYDSTEVQLETRLCRAGSVVGQGLVKVHYPWSNQISYHHIRTTMGGITSIPLKADVLPPSNSEREVHLELILDPECSVVLSAKFPFYICASQFIKFYGTHIIGYAVSITLALFAGQLLTYANAGYFPSFYDVFGDYPTYVTLVAIPTVLQHIWVPDLSFFNIPKLDMVGPSDNLLDTLILRTLLYIPANGLVSIYYSFVNLILILACRIWLFVKPSVLIRMSEVPLLTERKTKAVDIEISQWIMVWGACVASITIGCTGSVGIQLTVLFYLYKLIHCRMRCKAEEERRGPSASTTIWYYHHSAICLLLYVMFLTLPSYITWMKNLTYSIKNVYDVNSLQCILINVTSTFFWQIPTPTYNRSYFRTSSHILHFLAVISALYGLATIYRLSYYIAISFFALALTQTISYMIGYVYTD